MVDNAGIGVVSPMELVSLVSLRWQFGVNVFGQVDVTQEFLLLLPDSDEDGAVALAEKLRVAVERISAPRVEESLTAWLSSPRRRVFRSSLPVGAEAKVTPLAMSGNRNTP